MTEATTLPIDQTGAVDQEAVEVQRLGEAPGESLMMRLKNRGERPAPSNATVEARIAPNMSAAAKHVISGDDRGTCTITAESWTAVTEAEYARLMDEVGAVHVASDGDGTVIHRPQRKFEFRDITTGDPVVLDDLPEKIVKRGKFADA